MGCSSVTAFSSSTTSTRVRRRKRAPSRGLGLGHSGHPRASGASLGSGAVILGGVTIGEAASLVRAAVVRHDVEGGTTVAGGPGPPGSQGLRQSASLESRLSGRRRRPIICASRWCEPHPPDGAPCFSSPSPPSQRCSRPRIRTQERPRHARRAARPLGARGDGEVRPLRPSAPFRPCEETWPQHASSWPAICPTGRSGVCAPSPAALGLRAVQLRRRACEREVTLCAVVAGTAAAVEQLAHSRYVDIVRAAPSRPETSSA